MRISTEVVGVAVAEGRVVETSSDEVADAAEVGVVMSELVGDVAGMDVEVVSVSDVVVSVGAALVVSAVVVGAVGVAVSAMEVVVGSAVELGSVADDGVMVAADVDIVAAAEPVAAAEIVLSAEVAVLLLLLAMLESWVSRNLSGYLVGGAMLVRLIDGSVMCREACYIVDRLFGTRNRGEGRHCGIMAWRCGDAQLQSHEGHHCG